MKILHILKLNGIGGVQSQFEIFYNNLGAKTKSSNFIVNIGSIDCAYSSLKPFGNKYLTKVFIFLFSNDVILHSYNNLISKKFYYLFNVIRPSNLIFHERGNAWNLDSSEKSLVAKNANLSKLIICNSEATKIMLHKKFDVRPEKLKVIYNGVISNLMIENAGKAHAKKSSSRFVIGYVGRLESNKGVHTLVKSMKYLDPQYFQLNIIGDGSLREELEKYSNELGLKSVSFRGRIKDAWSEMKNFDVMVVPSIREPLGNVIIEAALHKVPIIASSVDGIIEIIADNQSGILLTPSLPVNKRFISENVPLPEFVVNVSSNNLIAPMELDSREIAGAIEFVVSNQALVARFAETLYSSVIDKFHIDRYIRELMQTYKEVLL